MEAFSVGSLPTFSGETGARRFLVFKEHLSRAAHGALWPPMPRGMKAHCAPGPSGESVAGVGPILN